MVRCTKAQYVHVMKYFFKSITLFALMGLSAHACSQVIINSNEYEPVFIDYTSYDPYGEESAYTVPNGKTLIITHYAYNFLYINSSAVLVHADDGSPESDAIKPVHIPVAAGNTVSASNANGTLSSQRAIIGYLVNNEGFGIDSGTSDNDIIDNDGEGIEIYPNPTDDIASVFVDYPGDWKMTVYDVNGQIVLETQSQTPVKSIDTNAFSPGTYIVAVRAKKRLVGSSQLIVQ